MIPDTEGYGERCAVTGVEEGRCGGRFSFSVLPRFWFQFAAALKYGLQIARFAGIIA